MSKFLKYNQLCISNNRLCVRLKWIIINPKLSLNSKTNTNHNHKPTPTILIPFVTLTIILITELIFYFQNKINYLIIIIIIFR